MPDREFHERLEESMERNRDVLDRLAETERAELVERVCAPDDPFVSEHTDLRERLKDAFFGWSNRRLGDFLTWGEVGQLADAAIAVFERERDQQAIPETDLRVLGKALREAYWRWPWEGAEVWSEDLAEAVLKAAVGAGLVRERGGQPPAEPRTDERYSGRAMPGRITVEFCNDCGGLIGWNLLRDGCCPGGVVCQQEKGSTFVPFDRFSFASLMPTEPECDHKWVEGDRDSPPDWCSKCFAKRHEVEGGND